MSRLLTEPAVLWAALLVVAVPVLIIVAGEFQERLRQRESPYERPLGILRHLTIPLLALWALLVFVFDVGRDRFSTQIVATAAIMTMAAAVWRLIHPVVLRTRGRGVESGRRATPQLLLMIPRAVVILVAGWLLVGQVWDVDLTGMFAALGVASLVVSLALQSTLSGLASGLLLLGDRPFGPGDWIQATPELEGQVVDIHWRTTRIRTRNGDLVVVPNAVLAEAQVVNFSAPTRLHRVVVPVQVAYSNPPSSATEMLLAAARATRGVLADPAPDVRVVQIDDPLMGYEAHLWVDDYAVAPQVASDFGALVWYSSHRMGVPLPSPAYDLYHHDPAREAGETEVGPDRLAGYLARAPLLAELDTEDLDRLAAGARRVRFRQGELILVPDAVDRDLYVLDDGRARMTVSNAAGRHVDLVAGDVFSVLDLADGARASPAVVATSDCEVIIIEGDIAGGVISRNPRLAQAMNQLMELRRHRLEPVAFTAGDEAVGGGAT